MHHYNINLIFQKKEASEFEMMFPPPRIRKTFFLEVNKEVLHISNTYTTASNMAKQVFTCLCIYTDECYR